MARDRKETPKKPAVEIDQTALAEVAGEAQAYANAQVDYAGAFADANRKFGQLQVAHGVRNLCAAAHIKLLLDLKESNGYKLIPIAISENVRAGRTFDEFCEFGLGRSSRSVYEEIRQLEVLGDAFEPLKRMGLDRKHFRALMKAPEEKRLELINGEAIDLSDPDAVKDFIEELADEAIKTAEENSKLKADSEDKDGVIVAKNKKIDDLTLQLTRKGKKLPWEKDVERQLNGLRAATDLQEEYLKSYLEGLSILSALLDAAPPDQAKSVALTMVTETNKIYAVTNQITEMVNRYIAPHSDV